MQYLQFKGNSCQDVNCFYKKLNNSLCLGEYELQLLEDSGHHILSGLHFYLYAAKVFLGESLVTFPTFFSGLLKVNGVLPENPVSVDLSLVSLWFLFNITHRIGEFWIASDDDSKILMKEDLPSTNYPPLPEPSFYKIIFQNKLHFGIALLSLSSSS